MKERNGEKVGGGFFVFRRGKKTNRISAKNTLPFEHPTFEAAKTEAERLTSLHQRERFAVFQQIHVTEPEQ